jgi:signal peptidase I
MNIRGALKKFWAFLKEDSWQSWVVSIILIIILVKGIFFPVLSFVTGTKLPLVIVESCSMYHHESNLDDWWLENKGWYEAKNITYEKFKTFAFKKGLNKGDIILVWGKSEYKIGDIIVFNAQATHPLIHRAVTESPLSTKGESIKNKEQLRAGVPVPEQLIDETNIEKDQIVGKAVIRIPLLGWAKLIFFEPFKPVSQRGLCS